RRRHTSFSRDWSSDVCSSDLGETEFCVRTASPALGSLNAGLQLYRIAIEKPEVFSEVSHVLHLPQYMSFLISGKMYSDMTSIGRSEERRVGKERRAMWEVRVR